MMETRTDPDNVQPHMTDITIKPLKIVIGRDKDLSLTTAVLKIKIIAEMTVPAPIIPAIALEKPILVIDPTLETTIMDHPMTAGPVVTSTTRTDPHIIDQLPQTYTEIIPIVAPDTIVATLTIL